MSNWIETEDGGYVNVHNVEQFHVVPEYKLTSRERGTTPTGRYIIEAVTTSEMRVNVRFYDTEEEAKAELRDLIERLTGAAFQQGTTVVTPPRGAAFPGADTVRLTGTR